MVETGTALSPIARLSVYKSNYLTFIRLNYFKPKELYIMVVQVLINLITLLLSYKILLNIRCNRPKRLNHVNRGSSMQPPVLRSNSLQCLLELGPFTPIASM